MFASHLLLRAVKDRVCEEMSFGDSAEGSCLDAACREGRGNGGALLYLQRRTQSLIFDGFKGNEPPEGCVYVVNQSISARQECEG